MDSGQVIGLKKRRAIPSPAIPKIREWFTLTSLMQSAFELTKKDNKSKRIQTITLVKQNSCRAPIGLDLLKFNASGNFNGNRNRIK
jgi:hypothetical protein